MEGFLSVESKGIGVDDPEVVVTYNENWIHLPIKVAKEKAIGIINAAAYAESEGSLFKALCPSVPKGFGKPDEDTQTALAALRLIRSQRSLLPRGIEPILGFRTQQPLVKLDYEIFQFTLELDVVRHHAQVLLEAAEAALFDNFWYKFGIENLNLELQQVQSITSMYKRFREVHVLKLAFNINEK